MSGQNRIINAAMARPNTPKGSALKSALGKSLSPSKIAGVTGQETQPCKKGSKNAKSY